MCRRGQISVRAWGFQIHVQQLSKAQIIQIICMHRIHSGAAMHGNVDAGAYLRCYLQIHESDISCIHYSFKGLC